MKGVLRLRAFKKGWFFFSRSTVDTKTMDWDTFNHANDCFSKKPQQQKKQTFFLFLLCSC